MLFYWKFIVQNFNKKYSKNLSYKNGDKEISSNFLISEFENNNIIFYFMIANSVLDLIGNTPMVRIYKLNTNKNVTVYAKLEGFEPSVSKIEFL